MLYNRLQNSPYFCVFKYARAVKQKVWNEAENRERDWGETLKNTDCPVCIRYQLDDIFEPPGRNELIVWKTDSRFFLSRLTRV